ncbi:enoyl-CoA hydratase/isomerase family protein [Streptomyces sp. NBC_00631]|uniref:enoyl-CoA hydratase/isomerase family protein n=1 Tax=Streptomyces sp. NBC_00631 TaxID=2975793 RepID=UPI0030E498E3
MSLLTQERHGAVLTVRVRNEPFNFMTGHLLAELSDTVARADRDPTVRAVVLASAVPGVFIGHYDIEELLAGAEAGGMEVPARLAPAPLRLVGALGRLPGMRGLLERTPVAGLQALLAFHDVVRRIQNSDKVYVAAIDGTALGGGFELALACDVRIMSDGRYGIGLMEIAFGLLPGGGGSQLLARTVGPGRALEQLLEGRLFTPAAALEAGLVHHVVPADEVTEYASRTATRLARRPPGSVRAVKQAVHRGGSSGLGRGLAMERALFLALVSRRSTQSALRRYLEDLRTHRRVIGGDVAAFVENRLPAWQSGTATEAETR